MKSIKHTNFATKNGTPPIEKNLLCDNCGKIFAHHSSLSRHKLHRCKGKNKQKTDIELLKEEITELKEQLEKQKIQQEKLDTKLKETEKPTQVNISVRNYIQKNYSMAPILTQLPDYSVIEEDIEEFSYVLVENYKKKILYKYLGDFIIKYYKKEDPNDQSIWNSDTSRLKYFIKRLIDKTDSSWYSDPKGVKTKQFIINPLLNYIREYCLNYLEETELTRDNIQEMTGAECSELQIKRNTIQSIRYDTENDALATEIIRYIAPHFYNKDFKLLK